MTAHVVPAKMVPAKLASAKKTAAELREYTHSAREMYEEDEHDKQMDKLLKELQQQEHQLHIKELNHELNTTSNEILGTPERKGLFKQAPKELKDYLKARPATSSGATGGGA